LALWLRSAQHPLHGLKQGPVQRQQPGTDVQQGSAPLLAHLETTCCGHQDNVQAGGLHPWHCRHDRQQRLLSTELQD
jgi:hypothetical protein